MRTHTDTVVCFERVVHAAWVPTAIDKACAPAAISEPSSVDVRHAPTGGGPAKGKKPRRVAVVAYDHRGNRHLHAARYSNGHAAADDGRSAGRRCVTTTRGRDPLGAPPAAAGASATVATPATEERNRLSLSALRLSPEFSAIVCVYYYSCLANRLDFLASGRNCRVPSAPPRSNRTEEKPRTKREHNVHRCCYELARLGIYE
ncbi:hypothetical protein HPB51_009264 [Rhipicephalus microplus]|uniref:Uncharacterized protein n=1 Tax=Rhipicephalus microplus TaxID=6941 RepID=A0A9J6F1B2_RHIMP|nr:hypothetical protein HPB51_009264 [Rhipicephalus microplus]